MYLAHHELESVMMMITIIICVVQGDAPQAASRSMTQPARTDTATDFHQYTGSNPIYTSNPEGHESSPSYQSEVLDSGTRFVGGPRSYEVIITSLSMAALINSTENTLYIGICQHKYVYKTQNHKPYICQHTYGAEPYGKTGDLSD